MAKPAASGLCPPDPAATAKVPLEFRSTKLELPEASGHKTLTVEVAERPEQTAHGLMYRKSLAGDRGMLFDLKSRKVQAFWMRNTCIPLDMMDIDDDGLIVGILEQVPVLNEEERSVGCPSRYVLEVQAGFSRKNGVRPGQRVKLPN